MNETQAWIDLFLIVALIGALPMFWVSFKAIGTRISEKILGDPVKDSLLCRIKSLEDTVQDQQDNEVYLRNRLTEQANKYERILSNLSKGK